MQSGVALVMRGLLQTMYAYCEGPPSTPQVEAELGKQLIEAGRVLRRYGRHVASGADRLTTLVRLPLKTLRDRGHRHTAG